MYKVYGNNKINGWEVIANKKSLSDARKIASRLSYEEYYSYLIKESSERGDEIVAQEVFKENTEKEKVKSFKEKYKVEVKERPKSRMKKKEELRKITEEYIDR